IMPGQEQNASSLPMTKDVDDNPTRHGPNEQMPAPAVYWSVLHHKNVHEGLPTTIPDESDIEQLRHDGIPTIIQERQPLISEASSRSALTADYQSTSMSPLDLPPPSSESENTKTSGWKKVREAVQSEELFIRHMPKDGDVPGSSKKWSDIDNTHYELTLRECLVLFLALLAVGVLAYSFLFEQWSILDSLYFTTVLLTTVGYGDITPTTPGGKLFASVFALGGIVIIGLALGVVGSQLVEAEINYTEKVKSKTSRALERAFAKGSHHRQEDKENAVLGTASLARSFSTSSMESIESIGSESTRGSVYDLDASTRQYSLSSTPGRHQSDEKKHKKQFPWLSVVQRHLPGFVPMLVGGFVMALLERWEWHDGIYYTVVTATTIGFGDITPKHTLSKLGAILFVPLVVAAMGYILGNVASFIVEQRRAEYDKKLWASEMKIEDLEVLDEGRDGGVSELEYIKFMLVAMRKVDADLFDNLRDQFSDLDLTGDGKITKNDLKILITRKRNKVSHKLKLSAYKVCF
ncbi:hypothetical protein ACHAXR_007414, partial [Thalassiosira sp. AJA248-18]